MRYVIAALFAVVGVVGCHENVYDETNGYGGPDNYVKPENPEPDVPVDLGGQNEASAMVFPGISIEGADIQLENYTVNTLLGGVSLTEPEIEVKAIMNDLPQFFYVSDDSDRILLMSRAAVIDESSAVIINEETTALAFATLNPLFVNLDNNNLAIVEGLIKNTPSYPSYLDIVKRTIAQGEEVFNVENTELLVALNSVLEEVCMAIDVEEYNARSIFTKASNIAGINPDPLSVQTSGLSVSIRNKGLVPTYECQVYHAGRVVDTRMIKSHDSYDFLDIYQTEDDFFHGEEETFVLSDDGKYYFNFDRTTDRAIDDFSRRMWGDVLSMIGLYNCDELLEISVELAALWAQLAIDPDVDITDYILSLGGMAFTTGFGLKWELAGKILNKFNVVYNVLKGLGNEISRSILGFTAPYYISFCLCSYDYEIMSCTEAELVKFDGDEQEGFAGQRLLLPLTVLTRFFAEDGTEVERSSYQKVKFEVVSGGGSVSDEIARTEADSQLASTYWTLGEEGEQKVKAYVIDMVTGVQVSEPVYFTAKIRQNADLTVRLDWHKLSGNTDIDLHVTDPYGEEIAFYNMISASGGQLDRDDVIGPGPEHIFWSEAPSGAYLIQVHYYGSETGAVTSYTVTINANGENYGPFTGSIGDQQLITIGVLNLPDGTFTRSSDDKTSFDEQFLVKENVAFPPKKK